MRHLAGGEQAGHLSVRILIPRRRTSCDSCGRTAGAAAGGGESCRKTGARVRNKEAVGEKGGSGTASASAASRRPTSCSGLVAALRDTVNAAPPTVKVRTGRDSGGDIMDAAASFGGTGGACQLYERSGPLMLLALFLRRRPNRLKSAMCLRWIR
eukprot:COSAG05_NODE_186_length_14726_cov_28.333630_3_plen_155_part_00